MEILFFDELGSTNDKAAELAASGAAHGTAVTAERQTGGRGRQGRGWESNSGGLYLSIILEPRYAVPQLTLLTSVAVARTVERLGLHPEIKWPNDIILNKRKLCGILTETKAGGYVIVGIGLNVNNKKFADELTSKATSIYLETGHEHSIAAMAKEITAEVLLLAEKSFSQVADEYRKRLCNMGMGILYENKKLTAVGITNDGQLIAENHDGTRIEIQSGEVNVRGIYGY